MDPVGPDSPVECRIVVAGMVQGVGYRWFARETARALGVRGWARNEADGTVVLEVAASREVMTRFTAALEAGPRSAEVRAVTVTSRDGGSPLPDGFTIVR